MITQRNTCVFSHTSPHILAIKDQDQLQQGTLEYAIHHLIENKLDLSIFTPKYKNDNGGRKAYDPAILLRIILFSYSKGITLSREMQWCCETNIIFKALSRDTEPHFTTIASFVSSHSIEIETLFEQILLICHEQGLLGSELFTIDGCKMSLNAVKEHSGTFKELNEKHQKLRRQIQYHLKEHERLDRQESKNEERIKRTEQAIETLDKAAEKIDRFLKTQSPRMGQGKRPKTKESED